MDVFTDSTSSPSVGPLGLVYSAGFAEGFLTAGDIANYWANFLQDKFHSSSAAAIPPAVVQFVTLNAQWMTEMAEQQSGQPYWDAVAQVIAQTRGLADGYAEAARLNISLAPLDHAAFLLLNAEGDLDAIIPAVAPQWRSEADRPFDPDREPTHCSVLIKHIPGSSTAAGELYFSHSTWDNFLTLDRIYKHYHWDFNNFAVSFSSSPAFLSSDDDFYLLSSGLAVAETTNDIYNSSLYQYVQPKSMLTWVRAIVANSIATSARQWVNIFAENNSGSYNGQWQVVDYKLFDRSAASLAPDTVWIIETAPLAYEAQDISPLINDRGYFPSYNVPYFPVIYAWLGFPAMAERYGSAHYSYSENYRAVIFAREQSTITDRETFRRVMTFNQWQTDPASQGNACWGIMARCDLAVNASIAQPFGGTDNKIVDSQLFATRTAWTAVGPTHTTQAPFSWSERDGLFAHYPRYGELDTYQFDHQFLSPMKRPTETP